MSFKILGLRAAGNAAYLKNLKPHFLYVFSSDYEFIGNDNQNGGFEQITQINHTATYPEDLYDLKMPNGKPLSIHISAVLGKNGSGKSSLLELLYLLIYCLAERLGYLQEREFIQRHIERGFTRDYFNVHQRSVDRLLNETSIEIYYEVDDRYFVIIQSPEPCIFELTQTGWSKSNYISKNFFYSIVVNYSLYGLNDKNLHFWLNPLFHKNDGYKTPIVLNPYREGGNIDVNSELHLAQTRILNNLIDEKFEEERVIDEKRVYSITFDVDPERIGWVEDFSTTEIMDLTKDDGGGDLEYVFMEFMRQYVPSEKDSLESKFERSMNNFRYAYGNEKKRRVEPILNDSQERYLDIQQLLAEYILTKIAKICSRYDEFKAFTKEIPVLKDKNRLLRVIADNDGVISKLLENNSHVTLKLKQAANAYAYNYFDQQHWQIVLQLDDIGQYIYRCTVPINTLTKIIHSRVLFQAANVIQFIPAAMYRPSIDLVSKLGNSSFSQLSSGEQQMLHSIHCIIYHLLNIDSLSTETAVYRNVNIVLDEIELYYHPEYQRRFVKILIDYLNKLKLETVCNLNIIFSTHSPFILSDIPHQNVLKLRDGLTEETTINEFKFGSNIHEMLSRSFFLENGLIGEFASKQIENIINTLNELEELRTETETSSGPGEYLKRRNAESDSQRILKTINLIGERVIKLKLQEMYYQVMGVELDEKSKAKQEILNIMDRYGLNKEDLQ